MLHPEIYMRERDFLALWRIERVLEQAIIRFITANLHRCHEHTRQLTFFENDKGLNWRDS
jgi:transposase